MTSGEFNEILWDFYAKNARDDLLWRQSEPEGSFDPYKILVSEIMLQQTQVSRVTEKYPQWLMQFPSVEILAKAPLSEVLTAWLGLGYNRRAKFLHESAKQIVELGTFPKTKVELTQLPGVGVNTAGAVLAYAFNQPAIFIETNIRTVFLYHYFKGETDIPDTELISVVAETLDQEHPREWYWALMDYGSYLKQTTGNHSKNSKHHTKQSKFEGSKRQVRGKVLRLLATHKKQSVNQLSLQINDERLNDVLQDLQKEGLITQNRDSFSLSE